MRAPAAPAAMEMRVDMTDMRLSLCVGYVSPGSGGCIPISPPSSTGITRPPGRALWMDGRVLDTGPGPLSSTTTGRLLEVGKCRGAACRCDAGSLRAATAAKEADRPRPVPLAPVESALSGMSSSARGEALAVIPRGLFSKEELRQDGDGDSLRIDAGRTGGGGGRWCSSTS